MDGKTKKILNYLKKSGGDEEALDISFALNLDENFVQNALESLVQENLAAATRNEQGKVFYSLADGGPPPSPAPKKAKTKAAAGPDDHFDEFVLENEAVNLATETIATHIDDITRGVAASLPAAPPPVPPSTSVFEAVTPPPVPPSTSVFEAVAPPPLPLPLPLPPAPPAPAPKQPTAIFQVEDDDFAPKPKKVKKNAPPPEPDIDADDDEFSPKPKKKAKKSAPPLDDFDADDEFSPKPKKFKERAAEFDGGEAHGDAGFKTKRSANLIAAAAAGIVVIIISVMLSVAVSGGKTKAAIENAEKDLIKTLDFETFKAETEAKIKKLEGSNRALQARVKKLEDRAARTQDRPAAAAAKKPARKR